MKTSEVLRGALDLLGPNGERWVQHGSHGPDYCLGLAVKGAIPMKSSWPMLFSAALSVLGDEVGCGHNAAAVFLWNDNPHTTWEDVQLTFKRAIARAEELEEAS